MNVKIVCIGNIKEKFYLDAISEYKKRLSKFCTFDIVELKEEKLPSNYSDKDIEKVKENETAKLIQNLQGYVVVLDIWGKRFDSVAFANKVEQIKLTSNTITFVIGGSYGMTDDIKRRADLLLSFSDFTLPHQLMRVVLSEQIYRAFTILGNITYHK